MHVSQWVPIFWIYSSLSKSIALRLFWESFIWSIKVTFPPNLVQWSNLGEGGMSWVEFHWAFLHWAPHLSTFLHLRGRLSWVGLHWTFLHLSPLFSSGGWVGLGSTGLYSTVSSIMAGHFFLSLSDPPNLVSSSNFNWAPMGPVTICRIEKICQTKGVNWACGSGLSHRYWIWDSQIPSNLLAFYPHTH